MAKFNWSEITADDVEKAIALFESDNPNYPEPRSTFLIYNGKKYPAKHIRGMAYKVHFGQEISKDDYAGGYETVRFFDKLGFKTQYTHKSINTHPAKKNRLNIKDKLINNPDDTVTVEPIKKAESSTELSEKIKIPTKGVIEQKNALQLILNKLCDGDVVCEKTFKWMKTPNIVSGEYQRLYDALSSYRGNKDFAKRNVTLRCDFVCESRKLIVEYDERQHFSEARRVSLLSYTDVPLDFDRQLWIDACRDIHAKDNQPKDRDEVRAYYDSTRDIEAYKHGYRLVRIMHGQVDFEKVGAVEELKEILGFNKGGMPSELSYSESYDDHFKKSLKIGLYLQTDELYGDMKAFNSAMDIVRESDIDILVLPEISYFPFLDIFNASDVLIKDDVQLLYDKAIDLSRDIGRAIVICNKDKYGTISSIFANAFATEEDTMYGIYIKHTMTDYSACEIENYTQIAEGLFEPILYKGHRIGMTICYDCNHSMFSRKYGLNGVDIILNSTGGNVVYDKWYKYNKVRAIENNCFTFVTMGGYGEEANPHNYVYGFTPEGKEMHPVLLNGKDSSRHNFSGGIYVYNTGENDGKAEVDPSIEQEENVNKNIDIYVPASDIEGFIKFGKQIADGLYLVKNKDSNVILCIVDGDDIIKPEKVLKQLYADELKPIKNKRYVIINRWNKVDMDYYKTKLSVILKVRAMENYCAVILSSENLRKCYQCGNNRTAQVVKEDDGKFGIDLSRTGGPETIWKNKQYMKASWRKNIEWLIRSMQTE